MVPKQFMVVAGEASGDLLGAELASAIKQECVARDLLPVSDAQPLETSLAPRFFGAGGPELSAAGMEVVCDMTGSAVVGLVEVSKHFNRFRRWFLALRSLARRRQPHVIICVDFSGFNLRFAQAIRREVRRRRGTFANWEPKIVQYVSPQVWASRPGRAAKLEKSVDLLLSIFPFEKDWYATHAPSLKVEYVGHPLIERYAKYRQRDDTDVRVTEMPLVLLLPGSRAGELKRHLPVMLEAGRRMAERRPVRLRVVLPCEELASLARAHRAGPELEVQVGQLAESLQQADVAIASTGTVTMECAYFGVPTVAMYKTSGITYEVAKRVIRVAYLAMPNVLAGHPIYPELIQHAATGQRVADEALDLLENTTRRAETKARLAKVIRSLGPPGAARNAARAVLRLVSATERARSLRAYLSA